MWSKYIELVSCIIKIFVNRISVIKILINLFLILSLYIAKPFNLIFDYILYVINKRRESIDLIQKTYERNNRNNIWIL